MELGGVCIKYVFWCAEIHFGRTVLSPVRPETNSSQFFDGMPGTVNPENSNGLRIVLRMRLTCRLYRRRKTQQHTTANTTPSNSTAIASAMNQEPEATYQILNDLVVDRGPSPYMALLEVFGNGQHLTSVQADGLVVSTPTGSTAYSVSLQILKTIYVKLQFEIVVRWGVDGTSGGAGAATDAHLSAHALLPPDAPTGLDGVEDCVAGGFAQCLLGIFTSLFLSHGERSLLKN